MTDNIYIRDLALRCIIGIYPEEREKKQDVVINIKMACDCRPAAATDDIAEAVDYKSIKTQLVAMVEGSDYGLIETLAERTAEICLANPRVANVQVCIDKPGALRFARSVAVEITRTRAE